MDSPILKSYLNIHQYLKDFYDYKKSVDPNFSYQTWSVQLGIKSKSYLRFAILGKRKISESLLKKLMTWFQLSESDQQYFMMLTQYTQTTDIALKSIFSKKLIDLIKLDSQIHSVTEITPNAADPVVFHLRDLLSCTDVGKTASSLAKNLNLTIEATQTFLNFLEKNNLAQKDGFDQWSSKHQSVKIADSPKNFNLDQYHQKSLQEAIQLITKHDVLRKYRGLNFFLSEDEFHQMNERVYDFLTALFNEYSQSSEALGKKIYQLNYNMSPRTNLIS